MKQWKIGFNENFKTCAVDNNTGEVIFNITFWKKFNKKYALDLLQAKGYEISEKQKRLLKGFEFNSRVLSGEFLK